jgi:hypothetical protein
MRARPVRSDAPTDSVGTEDALRSGAAIVPPRDRRVLWMIGLAALALRLALLPTGHWWDLTVDYNVFIDLGRNVSPYDTMAWLSHIAQSAHWWPFYEYYAYPPAPLYLYYPLAQLFHWLHPTATSFFPVQGSYAMPALPWDFYLLFKFPIWFADFGIAALLARMTGTARGARDYLLNPYVLLVSGAWTFDAIMVLGLLLGIYWTARGRPLWAGIALGAGTMVKYVPILVVPVVVIYLLKRRHSLREALVFVASYGVSCAVLIGPFLKGLLYVLQFQGQRMGGGMNWEAFFLVSPVLDPSANLDPLANTLSALSVPVLVVGLILGYWYCIEADISLHRMVLLTLAIYLVATKLVNEQYVLVLVPFTLMESYTAKGMWTWIHRAFWATALAFAVFRVPIDRFLWPLYHTVLGPAANVIAVTGATGLDSSYVPWHSEHLDAYAVLGLGVWCTVLCLLTIWCVVHEERVASKHRVFVTPAMATAQVQLQ